MIKYLLNFLFVFLILSSFSYAKNDDAKLLAKIQNEFGRDLTGAPFFLRYAYSKEFGKNWEKTDYTEREAFLMDYETNLIADQEKEKAETKAEAAKEKERLDEKKAEERQEKDRLKAQLAEEKAEQTADKERQKEFDTTVKDQERELQQLEREATQVN